MLEGKSKASRYFLIFAYTLLIIMLGLIIALSVTEPQHNLFPWQMGIGSALGALLLLAAFFCWDKLPCKRLKQSTPLYACLLLLYGVLLYAISCIGRNAVNSMGDYERLWNTALELSEGKSLSEEWYFKIYANNIKPMLYLSVLFRVARFFRFEDPFYFVLIISVLEVLAAVWSVGILAGRSREERAEYRIPILFLFVFTLPIWANVQAFYTDSMSFMTGITVLALLKLCMEDASLLKRCLLTVSAGVLTGLGISIKVTVLIPLIAGFIIFCLMRPPLRKWRRAGCFLLCAIATYVATSLWAGHLPLYEAAKETSEPIISWIAIGMKGNGGYMDNRFHIIYVNNLPSKQKKLEYLTQYIWENRSDFWNLPHLADKMRFNFASGSLGSTYFSCYAYNEYSIIRECFADWGKYYWRTSQVCFCYFFAIYAVYLAGAAATLYRLIKKQNLPANKAVADLSLLGLTVFLMIWEANNRQLYNQVPLFLLGAVLNIRMLLSLPVFNCVRRRPAAGEE